jgi:hypothetical protein
MWRRHVSARFEREAPEVLMADRGISVEIVTI